MAKYIKLEKELKIESDWISNYLIREGYHMDYTLESFKEIDRLFDDDMSLIFYDEDTNYHSAISIYIATVFYYKYKAQLIVTYKKNDNNEKHRSIIIKLKDGREVNIFSVVNNVIKKEYTLYDYASDLLKK